MPLINDIYCHAISATTDVDTTEGLDVLPLERLLAPMAMVEDFPFSRKFWNFSFKVACSGAFWCTF